MVDGIIDNSKNIELIQEINNLKQEIKELKNENKKENDELLLSEEEQRYVIFPIKYDKVWEMYKKAEANFWTAEELDLSKDNKDFNQNGAIRVMKYPYNFQKNLSAHVGVVVTDITDIHSKKDLKGLAK